MHIMVKRIIRTKRNNWQLFLDENEDLDQDSMAVLCQYFNKDKLLSETARISLIQPHLKEIQENL